MQVGSGIAGIPPSSGKVFSRACFVGPSQKGGVCSQAFLMETVESGDKNRDDFHCMQMQMSLVMSMRFIFGDE